MLQQYHVFVGILVFSLASGETYYLYKLRVDTGVMLYYTYTFLINLTTLISYILMLNTEIRKMR